LDCVWPGGCSGLWVILLAAMGIGAVIGAVAGLAVYGAKTAITGSKWSWKAAGAHAAGGLVGGGLFPPVLAGLAAVGLPTAAAYVLAGGIAWGGLWTAAQDAASWAFGLEKGMAGPGKYLVATGVGILATALLLPFASRALGPGMNLLRHPGTVEAFVSPTGRNLAANLVKSEAEFLAFGVMSETANVAANRVALRLAARSVNGAAARMGPEAASAHAAVEAVEISRSPTSDSSSGAPLSQWAQRLHEQHEAAKAQEQRTGAVTVLEASTK
jgi:hypothetical protein